jgi:DNA-binding MarR family transcriptional regulator
VKSDDAPTARASLRPDDDAIPLERIVKIADFRARLTSFLRQSERICAKWDLTPQRYLLLLTIKGAAAGDERMSFTAIAERLQLERNTVTELCARAQHAGLIRREPSASDQRVVYLRLTGEGERRLRGTLLETDDLRRELAVGFEELRDSFETAWPVAGRQAASRRGLQTS